jgi:hypothetical protein
VLAPEQAKQKYSADQHRQTARQLNHPRNQQVVSSFNALGDKLTKYFKRITRVQR